ncbi:hypothetical protein TrST_g1589 [Triparma strigata]|uniref:DUF4336 domain-containing protein n=1 Tax=Triparma strigata TaxID=1606541 RepID=A0A9W6ZZ50_9STRA|nr:hypothetical protein TrST_g1589 [Triparma strigata]
MLSTAAITTTATALPAPATAEITKDSNWPLWPSLPVFPYSRRKTIRREIKPGTVWTFDQLIGIYYVHVPIRMTVIKMKVPAPGLLVYAPVAPTKECLKLLQPLIDEHGPIKFIILPSTAVEHKVNAGPFARAFPKAEFYAVDQQYSFPVSLPNSFLGLPSWTKPLPRSGEGVNNVFGDEFEHEVLTVKPGPGSFFQDVALFHKPSKTLTVCDALLSVTEEPPEILTSEPEYVKALLFHARDEPLQLVEDSPEARRKGWRRIVLLFNFFIPGATQADIGLDPLLKLDFSYKLGWGGWQPFSWRPSEIESFEKYSAGGRPTLLPIIQIILNRGLADGSLREWVEKVKRWDFDLVIPQHLDAPLALTPAQFASPFESFSKNGGNEMRFCDEDVALLREAERGPLAFSVGKTANGPLTGVKCDLGSGEARVISKELRLKWAPK